MAQKSGLDSLLEALRQSGVNTGNMGNGSSGSSGSSGSGSSRSGSSGSRSSGGSSSRGSSGGSGGGTDDGDTLNLDFSFIDNWRGPKHRRTIVIIAIVIVLIILLLYWWFHPPINIHAGETWAFLIIVILIPLTLFFLFRSRRYKVGTEKIEPSPSKSKRYRWLCLIPAAIVCVAIVGGIASLAIIPGNAERYSNILRADTLEFSQDIQEVNYSEIPIIDRDSAILLGNREMGTIAEYVSQFEISDLYSQINYQGTPVRVSPLGYADLFKWLTNREGGIPAYALVDMTTQDAQIVRLGDSPIYYSQSEPLARNIDRYVQLSYPFYMFDEKSFEIDDDGHAWWICPVKKFTIGLFGGTTISRVVLVDATTGECTDYAVEDVPSWVDRVYPAELLIEQYNWYGSYNNGWLNSFLGQEGVVQTTPGSNGALGYNYIAKDDDVWVYTGVTSATSDNSIIGFVLVNQRTHESHFYSVSGATEESAMGSAEGQVQNLRYTATFPILINVANQPTYFMALKDAEGLVKKFAMIDIRRYQNVAVGDTVAETQETYVALLATNGVDVSSEENLVLKDETGTINSMTQVVIDGNSHYYVTIENDPAIYDFALPDLVNVVLYNVGDEITFTYIEGESINTVYEIVSPADMMTINVDEIVSSSEDDEEEDEESAESGGADGSSGADSTAGGTSQNSSSA